LPSAADLVILQPRLVVALDTDNKNNSNAYIVPNDYFSPISLSFYCRLSFSITAHRLTIPFAPVIISIPTTYLSILRPLSLSQWPPRITRNRPLSRPTNTAPSASWQSVPSSRPSPCCSHAASSARDRCRPLGSHPCSSRPLSTLSRSMASRGCRKQLCASTCSSPRF
jgi:hypothetical protein